MAETIVIQTEEPPENDATEEVVAQVVEEQVDEAFTLGMLVEKVAGHAQEISVLSDRISSLESSVEWAQNSASTAVEIAVDAADVAAEAAEEVSEIAEEIDEVAEEVAEETVEEIPDIPEDTPPGKTHWFSRPAKEWFGR